MIIYRYFLLTISLCITLLVSPLHAQEAGTPEPSNDIPLIDKEQEAKLDQGQKMVSERLMGAAQWIDSFFEDGRSISEENTTRATLKLELEYTKHDDFEFKPRVNIRLKLPHLEDRANLLIQGSDDNDFDVDGDPTTPSNQDTDRGQLEAALQYFIYDSVAQNFSTQFGGSYNYLYAGLRYRYLTTWDKWSFRLTDRIRWYTDDGFENKLAIDLERKLTDKILFRAVTNVTWAEDEDGVPHSELFRVYHVLNEEQAILYEAGLFLDTEPEYEVTDVSFKVRFRQRFYRDWLVMEITPQVNFPEDHEYEANPGILLRFEASFGYDSDTDTFNKIFNF
ncbi:MAG: hypothetical protein D6B25_00785 [Desulfobulbaceae bacterium]|nr:MAG: hypothetical protein D6B25_00785 [Desulfobulbaceae bacterium]